MALGKKIRTLRNNLGWTLEKLAEYSGVDVGTISALEMRDSSRSKFAPQLARGLNVSLDDLLSDDILPQHIKQIDNEENLPVLVRENHYLSPVKSRHYLSFDYLDVQVAAGAGSFAPEHVAVIGKIQVLESWARKNLGHNLKSIRVITAHGDSMSPTFNHEDILFVDEAIHTYQGDGVYILAMPDLRAKRLQLLSDKSFRIISDNAQFYLPEIVKGEEINNITICGRVVGSFVFNKL